MDRDLIEQAQHGDRDAFAILARTHGDRLMAIAHRILRDTGRAEDAVQQTLVIAWRELPALRDPDRFDAWLQRLLVNASYAEARRWRTRQIHTATQLADGPVLVVGGYTDVDVAVASAELYDPATNTFSPTGPLAPAGGLHTAMLLRRATIGRRRLRSARHIGSARGNSDLLHLRQRERHWRQVLHGVRDAAGRRLSCVRYRQRADGEVLRRVRQSALVRRVRASRPADRADR